MQKKIKKDLGKIGKQCEVKCKELNMDSRNLIAALSYAHFLFIVPLLLKRNDKFAQFHAKQGLVLFLAETILGILLMWTAIVPLFFFVVSVIGFIKAMQGEMWEIPIIGKYAKNIKI